MAVEAAGCYRILPTQPVNQSCTSNLNPRFINLTTIPQSQSDKLKVTVSDAPFHLPPLPARLAICVEGHHAAIDALAYLMDKAATEKPLGEGDELLLNLLYHHLRAWQAEIAGGNSRSPLRHPATLLPLEALREGRTLSDGELAIVDALLTTSRQWSRYLKQSGPYNTQ